MGKIRFVSVPVEISAGSPGSILAKHLVSSTLGHLFDIGY